MTNQLLNEKAEDRQSCSCHICQDACRYKPGWFKPGEAEKVSDFLGISLERLFNDKLAVDWYERGDSPIFLLSPAVKANQAGVEFPANPKGECVFFDGEHCTIHPVAPFECRSYMHNMAKDKFIAVRTAVVESWDVNQDQIKALLGREPEAEEYDSIQSSTW